MQFPRNLNWSEGSRRDTLTFSGVRHAFLMRDKPLRTSAWEARWDSLPTVFRSLTFSLIACIFHSSSELSESLAQARSTPVSKLCMRTVWAITLVGLMQATVKSIQISRKYFIILVKWNNQYTHVYQKLMNTISKAGIWTNCWLFWLIIYLESWFVLGITDVY